VAELPTGTVTFLFTDLEGSTRLWEEHPEAMRQALARHDEILRDAIAAYDGHVVKTTGDGIHAAFTTGEAALRTAVAMQRALGSDDWGDTGALRVRMGVHTGSAEYRDGDYYGTALNRAARLMSAAHGGQVVVSHATEELVRDAMPDAAVLVDLGEHRLRDLGRPERVFQLNAPGVSDQFPPLRSLDAFPGNLPLQLTNFVGRDDELGALAAALEHARLVTLTGVGGVGKTRLALQLAAEVVPRFPDGAWLCELAAATDDDALVQVVATTLGVQARPGTTLAGSIVEFVGTKELLVVLDNCEHLLDAAGHLAEAILQRCSATRIIATSREGLAVPGEHVVPLRSLGVTDAAVELFVDRAAAVRGGFALEPANAASVTEICRRLDGVPLAIELAAARVGALSPTDIASLLDERFRLLTGGRRTAVERHQTLRATVDWSYAQLSDIERLVFERLGVFAGSFDADAAYAVVSGERVERFDVIDALTSLVGKSMLNAEPTADDRTRYQMLETLRHYARERLDDAGEADAWRRRHSEYYARLAQRLGEGLQGPAELSWRARLFEEIDNLRSATSWSLDRDDSGDVRLALQLISALALEGGLMSRTTGIGEWAQRAARHLGSEDSAQRHDVLGAAAGYAYLNGDIDRALEDATAAIEHGIPADSRAPALAHAVLAMAESSRGNTSRALDLMDEAARALPGRTDQAFARCSIDCFAASWSMVGGEVGRARLHADAALSAAREADVPSLLAAALAMYGWSYWNLEPTDALRALEESVELTRQGASDSAVDTALGRIAPLRARLGDSLGALTALREVTQHVYDTGNHPIFIGVLIWGASALTRLSEFELAAEFAGAAQGPLSALFGGFASGPDAEEFEAACREVREQLGQEAFDAATARGAALAYEEAVEHVLEQIAVLIAEREANSDG
jgi:predicted ATPase/class 3 adenylate cyclase